MISVTEALEKLFLIAKVTPVETVELKKCLGRVLAKPLESSRSNPPFPSSAMDGYAIHQANLKSGAEFKVIGESAAGHSYPKKIKSKPNREVLRLEMVSYKSDHDLDVKINNLNLKLYGGEIIGIAGVAGNGQQSLAKLLTGHLKPTEGKIFINQNEVIDSSPKNFMNQKVAYIPEDRNKDGLVGDMSIWENIIMTETDSIKIFNQLGFINSKNSHDQALSICKTNDVRLQKIDQPARLLSGGNVQKLLIGKWLYRKPQIIIACQPTRGLDEGAIAAVHRMILDARKDGNGVIIIGEDLDELLSLSDKICVMYNGHLSKPLDTLKTDKLTIGMLMSGKGF